MDKLPLRVIFADGSSVPALRVNGLFFVDLCFRKRSVSYAAAVSTRSGHPPPRAATPAPPQRAAAPPASASPPTRRPRAAPPPPTAASPAPPQRAAAPPAPAPSPASNDAPLRAAAPLPPTAATSPAPPQHTAAPPPPAATSAPPQRAAAPSASASSPSRRSRTAPPPPAATPAPPQRAAAPPAPASVPALAAPPRAAASLMPPPAASPAPPQRAAAPPAATLPPSRRRADDAVTLWAARMLQDGPVLLRTARGSTGIDVDRITPAQIETIDADVHRAISLARHVTTGSTFRRNLATAPAETFICDIFSAHSAPSPIDGAVVQFEAICEYSSFGYVASGKTQTIDDCINFLSRVLLDARSHGHTPVRARFDRAPAFHSEEFINAAPSSSASSSRSRRASITRGSATASGTMTRLRAAPRRCCSAQASKRAGSSRRAPMHSTCEPANIVGRRGPSRATRSIFARCPTSAS